MSRDLLSQTVIFNKYFSEKFQSKVFCFLVAVVAWEEREVEKFEFLTVKCNVVREKTKNVGNV